MGSRTTVTSWRIEPVAYRLINGTTASLGRVTIDFACGPRTRSVVAFVKRLHFIEPSPTSVAAAFTPSREPHHWNYWHREVDAYGSTLLETLAPDLRAPACYRIDDDADGATLWLENLTSPPAREWDDGGFASMARALGRWQARVRNLEPSMDEWLARDFLAAWIPNGESPAARDVDVRDRIAASLVRTYLAPETIARARALVARREREIAMLATLPQGIAHNDLWTTNAFSGDGRVPIVIDWSTCGYAPLGSDAVNLLFDSAWMFDIPCSRLVTLVPLVREAYGDGACEIDQALSRRALDRAFGTIAALRFGLLIEKLVDAARDRRKQALLEERYGRTFEAIFIDRAQVVTEALASLD